MPEPERQLHPQWALHRVLQIAGDGHLVRTPDPAGFVRDERRLPDVLCTVAVFAVAAGYLWCGQRVPGSVLARVTLTPPGNTLLRQLAAEIAHDTETAVARAAGTTPDAAVVEIPAGAGCPDDPHRPGSPHHRPPPP